MCLHLCEPFLGHRSEHLGRGVDGQVRIQPVAENFGQSGHSSADVPQLNCGFLKTSSQIARILKIALQLAALSHYRLDFKHRLSQSCKTVATALKL